MHKATVLPAGAYGEGRLDLRLQRPQRSAIFLTLAACGRLTILLPNDPRNPEIGEKACCNLATQSKSTFFKLGALDRYHIGGPRKSRLAGAHNESTAQDLPNAMETMTLRSDERIA